MIIDDYELRVWGILIHLFGGVGGINAYVIAYCSNFKSILLGSFWIVCEWFFFCIINWWHIFLSGLV